MLPMLKKLIGAWKPLAVLALILAVYFSPPAHDRITHRLDDFRTQAKYFFSPPQDAVFLPTQQAAQQAAIDAIVSATMEAHAQGQTPLMTTSAGSTRAGPSAAPAITSAPLPALVNIAGVKYVDQMDRWNYCAP